MGLATLSFKIEAQYGMSTKHSTILLASLVILTLTCYFGLRSGPSGTGASLLASTFTRPCQSRIQPLDLQKLSNRVEATEGVTKLLELAKESPECRDAVINEVIGALNNADLEKDDSAFQLWATGSAILGRLKAVQAIDLLIAHLDLNDGFFSASMSHEPVYLAMEEMGEVAVPKLALALKTNPKKRIRLSAALCLSTIGGSEAIDALNSALTSETEGCVRRLITLLLPTPEETANVHRPITSQDGERLRQRILAYRCSN